MQILRDLEQRYGAVPWRFDVPSLCDALGPRAPTRVPETLQEAVQRLSCGLAEEMVIEDLIDDLRTEEFVR